MRQSRYFIQMDEHGVPEFLKSCLSKKKNGRCLVLSDTAALSRYRDFTETVKIRQLYLINCGDVLREARKINKGYDLIGAETDRIIDHIRRSQIDLAGFRTVIARIPERDGESFLSDVSFIKSHMVNLHRIFIIGSPSPQIIDHPMIKSADRAELSAFAKKERHMAKIPENMISAIDELVRKTKSDKTPEKLSEYRKIFKKCIPFGFRGWVTAFLLREYLSRDKSLKLPQLKEGVTLFIGIGKNRKVYPKDLIHLFINTGKIERDQIGEIRILDNYAFISIEKKSAGLAIENLNGINYRGRNLTVNFAKQK